MDDIRVCAADGCARTDLQGPLYCRMHYHRMRRTGRLDARPIRAARGTCTVEGCDQPDTGPNGLCIKHLYRVKRNGTTDLPGPYERGGSRNPAWTGANASYAAIHQRLRKVRGSARNFSCASCGAPARHWSYDHADPDERTSDDGPYSTDLGHYVPRCVPCHKRYDLDRLN